MNKTSIDYLTHTWNPIVMRCTKVSPACDNCWHITRANMLARNPLIPAAHRPIYAGHSEPRINPFSINDPIRRKKPSVIGVQFMGDLFHESVTFYDTEKVFDTIMRCIDDDGAHRHKFLILTKRPKRMKAFFEMQENVHDWLVKFDESLWIGVTVEDQQRADERIPSLLQIPAAVRFVSVEPMLGPIDLTRIHIPHCAPWNALASDGCASHAPGYCLGDCQHRYDALDWVICGGETGPGARPMHPDWARSLRDQCQAAGVPFFFKQWGEWAHAPFVGNDNTVQRICRGGKVEPTEYSRKEIKSMRSFSMFGTETVVSKIGKKAAGRLLDGREWNEYPA